MGRRRVIHRCTECGGGRTEVDAGGARRAGRGTRWSRRSRRSVGAGVASAARRGAPPVPIGDGRRSPRRRPQPTGVAELDRVLGGGLVPGSVTLLGGEPGIGKSHAAAPGCSARWRGRARALYVIGRGARAAGARCAPSGSAPLRADAVAAGRDVAAAHRRGRSTTVAARRCVVDRLASRRSPTPTLGSAPGSVAQVRECAHRLVREAKERGVADRARRPRHQGRRARRARGCSSTWSTPCSSFEGDRHHALRLLRAVEAPLRLHRRARAVRDDRRRAWSACPTRAALFLADRRAGVAGSVGRADDRGPPAAARRGAGAGQPGRRCRRPAASAQGLDGGRLALLLAVLERRAGMRARRARRYASAVGGVRLAEPGADLGVVPGRGRRRSTGRPLPADLVACGEVGLGGELRQVAHTPRRLAEAARLGFRRAIVPASAPDVAGHRGRAGRHLGRGDRASPRGVRQRCADVGAPADR